MYAGKIVESATAPELYANPRHPYTVGLLKSVPRLDQTLKGKLEPIEGMPPDLIDVIPGCSFQPRCPFAVARCSEEVPPLHSVGDSHTSACWEWERVSQTAEAAKARGLGPGKVAHGNRSSLPSNRRRPR